MFNFGLNPFEIRGGLKLCPPARLFTKAGLNPFEIRGGLKPGLHLQLQG